MSELAIQQGVQTAIQELADFSDDDVVINDWSILDGAFERAPYVIIENSDEFDSMQDSATPQTEWNIKLSLLEKFTDWKETLDNFRLHRQAILDKINTGDIRTAGGLTGTNIRRVFSTTPIVPYYDPYISDELLREALPLFIIQTFILECLEF